MCIRIYLLLFFFVVTQQNSFAQAAPPSSGNAMDASRSEAMPVNNYTGIPTISLPIYGYSHKNGIGINLSLDYFAGGIKTEEQPTAVGIGWSINGAGVITRTVRGVPDDCPGRGFLYAPSISKR